MPRPDNDAKKVVLGWDPVVDLGRISTRVVLSGDPTSIRVMTASRTTSVVVVPEVGHQVMQDGPAVLHEALGRFLARV